MKVWIKRFIARLPEGTQTSMKRSYFARQIRRNSFVPDEPEIRRLGEWLGPGDWAIDVGANIGYYTLAMARLVETAGRVISLEPMPNTFDLLASNVRAAESRNVTLLNVAASSSAELAAMDMPVFTDSGLSNPYQAQLASSGAYRVLCSPLDSLALPHRISLIKIDAEGHDLQVLQGADTMIHRDRPVLIVEGSVNGPIAHWLRERDYSVSAEAGSSNIIALPKDDSPTD